MAGDHLEQHAVKISRKKIVDMEELWQLPCTWAALDGCNIPMKCPPGGLSAYKDYHHFKNFYLIVLFDLYRVVVSFGKLPRFSHFPVDKPVEFNPRRNVAKFRQAGWQGDYPTPNHSCLSYRIRFRVRIRVRLVVNLLY